MIFMPARAVIKRELLSGMRSPRPFFFLALFMMILILGLFFMLDVVLQEQIRWQGVVSSSMVRNLFMSFGMGLYFCAVLLIPPMAGVSICVEKQQGSYDLLRMSYIRASSLALAKLINVLSIYLMVVIASLPFVGVFFFLVGIDWDQFLITFVLLLTSALSMACIGLLCSSWCYRTLPAIISTYVLGILFHGGFLVAIILFFEITGNGAWLNKLDEDILAAMIPFIGIGITSQFSADYDVIIWAVLYHGMLVAVSLSLALIILRRPARPILVDQEKPIDSQVELKARRKKFPYYLLDPRRRKPMIPDHQNPMYGKELQSGLLTRGSFSIRVLYVFTLFSLAVAIATISANDFGRYPEAMAAWAIFFDMLFVLVLTPTLVATTMAKEWEWENVDSLRTTLLSPAEIATGKFRAALRTTMLPVFGCLLGNSVLIVFGYDSEAFWRVGLMALCTMLVAVFYALSISFWASASCRRSLTGLLLAYGASILAIALLPLVFIIAGSWLFGDVRFDSSEELFYCFLSPVYAYIALLENFDDMSSSGVFSYWILNVSCFIGLSFLFLGRARQRYVHSILRGD